MLIALIVIGATGLLAMTFAILGRASHPRLVGTFSGFLNVILFFPSGAIYPVESFPHWLRVFARYNPETHPVSAIKQILFKGADFSAVTGDIAFLLVFMVLMLVSPASRSSARCDFAERRSLPSFSARVLRRSRA